MRKSPWLWFVAAVVTIGAVLRARGISGQIVADDELHTLYAILAYPASYLSAHFMPNYVSIPEALLLQLLAAVVGLDETTYRLPALGAGLASLLVLPALAIRRVGLPAAGAFASLLAISPLLIFYSRFERPYSLAALLVAVAVLGFERWLRHERGRDAALYVACGAGAVYVHLLTAPAVFAPLLYGLLSVGRSADPTARRRRLGSLALLGAALGLGLAVVLINPLLTSAEHLFEKAAAGSASWMSLSGALLLLAGTGNAWLGSLFWLGCAAGLAIGLRRQASLTALIAAVCAVQLAAVLVIGPWMIDFPWVLARYLLCLLPLVLLLPALAISELGRLPVRNREWPMPMAATIGLMALLYLAGPLPRAAYVPNNFTNHNDFNLTYVHDGYFQTRPARVSAFYERLGREAGHFEIVEAPWYSHWGAVHFHHYQRVHGRPVRIGFVEPLVPRYTRSELDLTDRRVRFRRFVDLSRPERLEALGIRYVVIHKDLQAEMAGEFTVPKLDLEPLVALYRERFGEPAFEDDSLIAFDTR